MLIKRTERQARRGTLAASLAKSLKLDEAKVTEWLGKGAQPSDAVAKLIKAAGITTS